MLPSALGLAAALAALVAVRARAGVRTWGAGAVWAGAALLVAWIVGYAALIRGLDPALLTGVATLRPLAAGGWAGAAVAAAGALIGLGRPGVREEVRRGRGR